MILLENIFFKILDYKNLDLCSLLKKISEILNVQFFQDNDIYTLGNEHFIIDINDKVHITFVEESLYSVYRYVEEYLTFYLRKKNYKKFYILLKFFIFHFSKTKTTNKVRNFKGGFCKCLSSFDYCNLNDFEIIKNDLILNIFTHKYESFDFEPYFFEKPTYVDFNDLNLGECLDYEMIDKKYFIQFSNSFCLITIDDTKIFIDKKMKIYFNDVYNEKISFLFKYGLDLKQCFQRYKEELFQL